MRGRTPHPTGELDRRARISWIHFASTRDDDAFEFEFAFDDAFVRSYLVRSFVPRRPSVHPTDRPSPTRSMSTTDRARRRLSWRACVESDDEENETAMPTTTRGKGRGGDGARDGGDARAREVLGRVDVNAGGIGASPGRGKRRETKAKANANASPRAYLAGSTPGVASAKHASRVRALMIDEDEEEEEEEEAFAFAFESGARDGEDDAADTTDSTVVLTPRSATARRASRSVSETLAVFKSLAHLAASPSEEEARARRAAPTPANTPATTNEPAVDLSVSPIIGVRRRDEGAWNATMERIIDKLDIRDEDEGAAATARRPSRYKMARASAVAAVMLQVAARMFAVMTSFASSNDSLGRRCVIEGGAFALSWWFGAKVNWDSLSSTSYVSYGGLMRAQRRALRLQRALQRDEAFRAALDFVGRASALFAYGSMFLGVLACVVKIAAAAIDSASSTTPTGKNAAGTTKHKKNVPSMRTPVGFVLGKASSRDVASPTPPTNSAALRAADASLSPLVV